MTQSFQDKNYEAEVQKVVELIQTYAKGAKSILEFGAGTGIHASLLSQGGYEVVGIELSSEMVKRAKVNVLEGDIRTKSIGRKFDSVISLFHVMSYLPENADLIAALKNANQHLNPGGIFFFDFWFTPAVLAQKPEVRVKRMENEQIRVVRLAEPECDETRSRVDVHYTIFAQDKKSETWQSMKEVHRMRHFSLPEIKIFAAETGFEVVNTQAFPTGELPSEKTWGVGVVLRKMSNG